jgi:GNAT superfamily N-acetyltransferase
VLVDHALVQRLEAVAVEVTARLVAAMVPLAPDPPPEAERMGGGVLVATGRGRYVNRAVGLTLGELDADAVDTIAGWYDRRDLTPAVELSSWAPATTVAALTAAGFRPDWSRSMLAVDPRSAAAVTGAPEVVRVDDDELARAAADVMASTAGAARETGDLFMAADRLVPGCTQLVARLDGAVVGCGSLTVLAGTGWLGAAATVPAARGRGVQTALLRHRLRLAADAGCDLVGVTASVGSVSYRNLQRVGFRLVQDQWVMERPASERGGDVL